MPKQIQQIEPPVDNGFIDRAELARRLKVSIGTIHNHCKNGRLAYIKLGHRVLFDWETTRQQLLRQARGGVQ